MKTTVAFLLISVSFINLSCHQRQNSAHSFKLEGKISGVKTGRILLEYVSNKKYIQDTTDIKDGAFTFIGNIDEPTSADLIGGDDIKNAREYTGRELNRTKIFIEPGKMKIFLAKDKFKELKMTGSKTQDELVEYNRLRELIKKRTDIVWAKYKPFRDSVIKNVEKSKIDELIVNSLGYKQLTKLHNESDSLDIQFAYSHPKSYLSGDLLWRIDRNERVNLPLDSLKLIYNRLDIKVQKSRNGILIKNDIVIKENNRIGASAPDFKAIDLNNKTVTLSEFKGKNVVLMDFWASWCGPCRESFPHLKNVYKKYHPKGFEIISVSVDFNRDAWIEAVKQENIETWHPVPVAEKYLFGPDSIKKDDIYANYFVQAIPRQILIDKSGKIAGNWVGKSRENEKELETALNEIFK
jgi:peroxiredoxin